MTSKDLRAQRAKLIADARALVSGATVSAEDAAKFEVMMAEADGIKVRIDQIERADTEFATTQEALYLAAQREGAVAGGEVTYRRSAYEETTFHAYTGKSVPVAIASRRAMEDTAFSTYLRGGLAAVAQLGPDHMAYAQKQFSAALGDNTGSGGGFTIPQGFYDRLFDALKWYGGMTDVSFMFDTATGNPLPIPTDNDTTNSGSILTENTQVGTQDVTFGQVNLGAYTYTSKLVLVANQLLQDSAFNLDSFLADKLGIRIARAINTHFTVGTGASQPTGVVTGATLGYTAGGSSSSGEVATILTDDLIELEHSVDPAYRKAARFMMADSTLKQIKKLKDGLGRPLWLSGIAVKEPDTINGYPYTINQDMPAEAASAKTMLFGDFSNYFIRRVAGVQVLRLTERYADFNQTGFVAFQRWDGNLIDAGTHPIKYLQQSAD